MMKSEYLTRILVYAQQNFFSKNAIRFQGLQGPEQTWRIWAKFLDLILYFNGRILPSHGRDPRSILEKLRILMVEYDLNTVETGDQYSPELFFFFLKKQEIPEQLRILMVEYDLNTVETGDQYSPDAKKYEIPEQLRILMVEYDLNTVPEQLRILMVEYDLNTVETGDQYSPESNEMQKRRAL
ncbi:hypothetical protein PPERSA_10951 [Pseudocohnilembus persalinus]|uniref:Uncharacterized protein n=1 Tax=Pseudocohnilembus persalinus TaxID=266149 RepID=A0A0V0QC98_PSEPJ|nr:hypothetical protein PPERSA_10951 [Pseudocohnilembus persalinus]|eukprot:KRW99832.1 hypothetical protein PPERSA_10951 [Pseudocohnilembus persalinus]